ncbi:UNVERIFIED_CONTAM: hypothetical protein FKN15_075564 [Acipenser sinensis]
MSLLFPGHFTMSETAPSPMHSVLSLNKSEIVPSHSTHSVLSLNMRVKLSPLLQRILSCH